MCQHGKTIAILESRWGNDGYAFWFKLLEILGSSDGHFIDYRNDADREFLYAKTRVSEDVAKTILETMAKCGAIDAELWAGGCIYSQNFVDNISDAYSRRKELLQTKTNLLEGFCMQKPLVDDICDGFLQEETGKEKEKEKEKEKVESKAHTARAKIIEDLRKFYLNNIGLTSIPPMEKFGEWLDAGKTYQQIRDAITSAADYPPQSRTRLMIAFIDDPKLPGVGHGASRKRHPQTHAERIAAADYSIGAKILDDAY